MTTPPEPKSPGLSLALLLASLLSLGLLAVALGFYFGELRPRHEQALAAADYERARAIEEARAATKAVEQARSENARLADALSKAKDEQTRAVLELRLCEARSGNKKPLSPPTAARVCPPSDPLCNF